VLHLLVTTALSPGYTATHPAHLAVEEGSVDLLYDLPHHVLSSLLNPIRDVIGGVHVLALQGVVRTAL